MRGFGWDIARWENEGKWLFVDAYAPGHGTSRSQRRIRSVTLLARIEHAVRRIDARRVSLDSLGGIFAQFDDSLVRHEIFRVSAALKRMHVTAVLTTEREAESDGMSHYGVEEFVADNVIILRNTLEQEKRRRTVEILKFRGAVHQKGEFPFTVTSDEGVVVLPLSAIELRQKSSSIRVTSGNAELDTMCGGGFFRDSIILASGATGTGKTLLTTEFIAGTAKSGERCLLFAFEEVTISFSGMPAVGAQDFERMEAEGNLRVVCSYPESASLEDHLLAIKKEVDSFRPDRVAVDSLSAPRAHRGLDQEFPRIRHRVDVVHQARGIRGAVHRHQPGAHGRRLSNGNAHFDDHGFHHPAAYYVEVFGEMHRGAHHPQDARDRCTIRKSASSSSIRMECTLAVPSATCQGSCRVDSCMLRRTR